MTAAVWVRTDRATFEDWARARPGVALPEELRPEELRPEELRPAGRPPAGRPTERLRPEGFRPAGGVTERPAVPVPPVVAAALALHGYAEAAVIVRRGKGMSPDSRADRGAASGHPGDETFGCFGLSGDLAAGLVRAGQDVDIGLFGLAELVDQVVRLVPARPSDGVDRVEVMVLGADAAAAGWQQILIGTRGRWRVQLEPDRWSAVAEVRAELAADLRWALAEALAQNHPEPVDHDA